MNTGYEVMKTLIGLQEHRDKDKLMELFKSEGIMNPEYPDEVFNPDGYMKHGLPWCAVAVTYCERVARGPNVSIRYAARKFEDYGMTIGTGYKDLSKAREGDILIFSRGNNGYSGHVAYFVELKQGMIKTLGGNQQDAVSYAFYKPERLIGIQRVKYE